tara:strand:+ start:1739 stop:2008 length:270 start_codon:yes stop_codon:yes gene_type:complete
MKNKLIYPVYGILLVFLLCIGKLAVSKENYDDSFPGTRWLEINGYIGASKNVGLNNQYKDEIVLIEFAEDIPIPELPNLPDIPLTEEDK